MKYLVSVAMLAILAGPGLAYVDSSATLGKVIQDATTITVLRVDKVSAEKRVVLFKKVADLKGASPADEARHALGDGSHPREPRAILELAEPGATAVCFQNGKSALVCLGRYWYEVAAAEAPWWSLTYGRAELSLAYFGSSERLAQLLPGILRGETVVITAVAHSVNDFWAHGDVLNKKVLGGGGNPIWRIKASLQMPHLSYQVSKDPQLLVGFGAGGLEDVPPLLKLLASPDTAVRRGAAVELGLIGRHARDALPSLQPALKDSDFMVRIAVAEAILRIDPKQPAALPVLLDAVKHSDLVVRRQSLQALARIGAQAKSAVPELVKALKDPDAGVRWAAADALAHVGPEAKAAVPALVEALKDPSIRPIAIDALGGIGAEAKVAAGPLAELCQDQNVTVKRTAAMALARIGGTEARPAVPVFIEMLKGHDARLRWDAMLYLAGMGREAKEAVPALAELAKADGVAACCLAQVGGPEAAPAIPMLIQLLSSGEWDTSYALVEIGPAIVDPLLDAARNLGHWKARSFAANALAKVIAQDAKLVPKLTARLKTADANTRMTVLNVLSELGEKGKPAVPAVVGVLKDPEVWVRVTACWTLIALQDGKSALPVLEKESRSADTWVRRSTTQALTALAAKDIAPILQDRLKDGDGGVRVVSAAGLVQLGGLEAKDALPILQPALKDPDAWTRQHAAIYLGQLGPAAKPALPALGELLNDPADEVRKAAAEAIKQVGAN